MTKEQQEAQDRLDAALVVARRASKAEEVARSVLTRASREAHRAWRAADDAADAVVALGLPDPRNVP